MAAVTETFAGGKLVKPFSWSYSKLKNFESCPKRHWHIDVQRDVKEEESDDLKWGNYLHKALAERLSKGTPLPKDITKFEKWAARVLETPGEILVEQKLAIDKTFGKCSWFGPEAWYRAIGDVIKISPPVALVGDWKTGKIVEDSVQLALAAACVFAHYPEVIAIRSEFFWLKFDASTKETFKREDMPAFWRGIWPRIETLKQAHDKKEYPAKPGGLCRRYCPVKQCPHHGE